MVELKKNKVVCIAPFDDNWSLGKSQNILLRYTCSEIRANGFEVFLIDAESDNISLEDCITMIRDFCPDYIVLGFLFRTISFTRKLLKELNACTLKCKIILQGHCISNYVDIFLDDFQDVDYFILERPDVVAPELLKLFNSRKTNLNNLPIAYRKNGNKVIHFIRKKAKMKIASELLDREYLFNNYTYAELTTSLGCGYSCTFCNNNDIQYGRNTNAKWEPREVDDVLDEMKHIISNYGIKKFRFIDNNFFGDCEFGEKRAHEIADKILALKHRIKFDLYCRIDAVEKDLFMKLKHAGLQCVHIGIESMSTDILKRYNKGITKEQVTESTKILQEMQIILDPSFILFDPLTSLSEIDSTLRYIQDYNLY